MKRSTQELRADARRIWLSGLEAVRSDRLLTAALRLDGSRLSIADEELELSPRARVLVVGAGKAGAGMAAGVEAALRPLVDAGRLDGWVNVPADCLRPLEWIHLHAGRPPGVNEPTDECVAGTAEILRRAAACDPADVCLALVSGGGSALLSAPAPGMSLADKLALTRWLSAAGAPIEELNVVRTQLSRVKGGGLASACQAGRLYALIISDVLGDSLESIASGPTVESHSSPEQALEILARYGAVAAGVAPQAIDFLRRGGREPPGRPSCLVRNIVLGNNALAVDAAGAEAERLGYSHAMLSAAASEGAAEDVGRRLAQQAVRMLDARGPDCLVSGGEPVVTLAREAERGRGGRNQQLVLAALEHLQRLGKTRGACLLSGGTDGEDGPTDAAGAWIDADVIEAAANLELDVADALRRNDAYPFFAACGGLFKTGRTDTNVCDLRVVVVERRELPTSVRRG